MEVPPSATPAGDRLHISVGEIESELLRAQGELSQSDVELSGIVRIGAPDGFTTHFLCSRLGKLKAQYPSLNIQLVPMSRTLSLSRREADLAITIERPEEGRLAARKLIDYSLHFYAAKSCLAERATPLSIADLERHSLVTYVQDLIFAVSSTLCLNLLGPNYRRLECWGPIVGVVMLYPRTIRAA